MDDELKHIEQRISTGSNVDENTGEPVIYRCLESREFFPPWMNVDATTRGIIGATRAKGLASRRQTVSDTLRCSVVSDYVPDRDPVETLYDFCSDLDNRAVGVISKSARSGQEVSVDTRKESMTIDTPLAHDIDLSLHAYVDAFSSDDVLGQLPYDENGSPEFANVSSISKTIPWFDEFKETVQLKSVMSLDKVFRAVSTSFARLKDLYAGICRRASLIYQNRWNQVSTERLSILRCNFPKGVIGFRALSSPGDPRHIKALIVKQVDKSASQQIFGGMGRASRLTEAEEKEMERETGTETKISKYAPIPDMKRIWQTSSLPRVTYVNTNMLVENMAHTEHESINELTPWSLPEVRVYLERLAMYGKNFKRIATNLPDKTEGDCVEFYYRFKIHLGMKQIISQNRIDKRNDNQSNSNGKALIDRAMGELEGFLSGTPFLGTRKQLENWNIRKAHGIQDSPNKLYGREIDPESPRRERRNAVIDVLVSVIRRGHSIPPQLALLVEASAPGTPSPSITPPPLVPQLMAPAIAPTRPQLTLVQTAVTVLQTGQQSAETRQLQPHKTI
jgi:hypothetical protein